MGEVEDSLQGVELQHVGEQGQQGQVLESGLGPELELELG